MWCDVVFFVFFFFNDTATTEIYTFPYTTLFRSRPFASGGRPEAVQRPRRRPRRRVRARRRLRDRKSTRLNSSHLGISYAVFCLKKKKKKKNNIKYKKIKIKKKIKKNIKKKI